MTTMGDVARALPLATRKAPLTADAFRGTTNVSADTEMVVLPDPVGFHMLIALPTIDQQTVRGIIIPDVVVERERAATVVGRVLAMGPLCYADKARFPDGKPWCKVGDDVLFSRYSGMRFKSMDADSHELVEYRMLSDDNIVGVVPEGAKVGAL